MWFASLSNSYNRDPWVVSLVDRLLEDEPTVVDGLMGENGGLSNIRSIRGFTYDYDFTREANEWNKRIPGE